MCREVKETSGVVRASNPAWRSVFFLFSFFFFGEFLSRLRTGVSGCGATVEGREGKGEFQSQRSRELS